MLRRLRFPAATSLAAALLALCWSASALAGTAVLSRAGTLYEVFPAPLSEYDSSLAGTIAGRTPVLLLRSTPSAGTPSLEVVAGTRDSADEGAESVEIDEATGTVFTIYTKFQGLMSDLHVAVRRDGQWAEENILPNVGLYLSLNPRVVVTRQRYVDFDGSGGTVTKSRSILHLIWWEESGASQARYAALFVEDGVLRLEDTAAYNLNDIAGTVGTPAGFPDLPLSSYTFPVIQRDSTTNGGALASFADLVTGKQTVLQITFPDDITKLAPPGATSGDREVYSRSHLPIGRDRGRGTIPRSMSTQSTVSGVISPHGTATLFYWSEGNVLKVVGSDAPETASPLSIPLRPDFSVDRAIAVVREMAEKE